MIETVLPLVWLELGTVEEILELPKTLIDRLARYSQEESVIEKYKNLKGFNYGG